MRPGWIMNRRPWESGASSSRVVTALSGGRTPRCVTPFPLNSRAHVTPILDASVEHDVQRICRKSGLISSTTSEYWLNIDITTLTRRVKQAQKQKSVEGDKRRSKASSETGRRSKASSETGERSKASSETGVKQAQKQKSVEGGKQDERIFQKEVKNI